MKMLEKIGLLMAILGIVGLLTAEDIGKFIFSGLVLIVSTLLFLQEYEDE